MNLLDATITAVGEPYWDEKYKTWRVEITYNCWGSESKSERWEKTEEAIRKIHVGQKILV